MSFFINLTKGWEKFLLKGCIEKMILFEGRIIVISKKGLKFKFFLIFLPKK